MSDDLTKPYKPVAVVFPDADVLEYVTKDCATYALDIDANLALLYDMKDRHCVGFRLANWSQSYVSAKPDKR